MVLSAGNALDSFHADTASYKCVVSASAADGASVAHEVHLGSATKSTVEGTHFTDATDDTVEFALSPNTAIPGSSILVDPMTAGAANAGTWTGAKAAVGYIIISVDGGAHVSSSNKTVTTGDVTVSFTLAAQ